MEAVLNSSSDIAKELMIVEMNWTLDHIAIIATIDKIFEKVIKERLIKHKIYNSLFNTSPSRLKKFV